MKPNAGREYNKILINGKLALARRRNQGPSYKQQAVTSCKLGPSKASLTRKLYNDILGVYRRKDKMKTSEALKIIGGSLSKPSKMPGWSIGLPAKECKTGGKLQAVPGSVCYDCYALKGCYVFKVVQDAQYRRLAAIKSPSWVQAMAHLINSKKPDVFRWHDSGDVQDLNHLKKIYEVCRLTPSKRHWLPDS